MAPPPTPHPTVVGLKQEGDQSYAARNYPAALRSYCEALEEREDVVVLSNRSAAYAQARRFKEALSDAERALVLQPRWARLHHRRGHALLHLGRYNEAVLSFEKGLRIEPEDKDLSEALKRAREYTELDPDAPPYKPPPRPKPPRPAAAAAGAAAGCAGPGPEIEEQLVGKWGYGTAGKSYDVARGPGGELVYHGPHQRVGTVSGTLRWESDKALMAQLASEEGEVVGNIRLTVTDPGKTIVSNYRAQANPDWGKDIIAHKGRPPSADELRDQGNKFFREGKYSLAIRAYNDAIAADPKDPKAFSNRAAAQMEMLKSYGTRLGPDQIKANPYYGSAMSDLEESLNIDKKYTKAWARKGQLLCMGGEVQKGLIAYEWGLNADPENKECLAGKDSCQKWLAAQNA